MSCKPSAAPMRWRRRARALPGLRRSSVGYKRPCGRSKTDSVPSDLRVLPKKGVCRSSKKKILIIDDRADTRLLVSARLKQHQCDTVVAADALQAIAAARQTQPDAIILDLGLPGGNGFIVLDRLKANATLSGIPVIIDGYRAARKRIERTRSRCRSLSVQARAG